VSGVTAANTEWLSALIVVGYLAASFVVTVVLLIESFLGEPRRDQRH
jgi:hypothetical protein